MSFRNFLLDQRVTRVLDRNQLCKNGLVELIADVTEGTT
jgi:hypothetical protein